MTGPATLRVALDATPLIGHRTGVGEFCRGALGGLARRPDLEVHGYVVSWRRRSWATRDLPEGVASGQRPMPARPLHVAWRHAEVPPMEWFLGSVDVVHGTNFVVPPTRRAGRVVTVHDLTVAHYPELCDRPTLAYPSLIRRALRGGAFVHTPSAFVAQEVVEWFGVDPDRVRAVHSGIPEHAGRGDAAAPFPADLLPAGAGRYVLSLATAEPRKDLPVLVRAFDELAGDHPDVALVLAGQPGWGEQALTDALARSRFAARIVRPGWLDDGVVAGLLAHASVLAYPSRYEGFGFPALEGMAQGVPVVATATGALPEVVGDGARLVPVGDAAALAGAIAGVLDSAEVADSMALAGRRRAAKFTWTACADGLAALYRDVAATVPSGSRLR